MGVTSASRLGCIALVAVSLGCGSGSRHQASYLLDLEHTPDVLTEERTIAVPPSLSGNRLLSGWWPWLFEGEQVVLTALGKPARLELVNVGPGGPGGPGRKTLSFDLLQEAASKGAKVQMEVAGRPLGSFPLTDPLHIPLPEDLPRGRVRVDLRFDWGSRGVLAAAVRPVRPAGKVRLSGHDVEQSGESLVDFVRPVPAGATLTGTFRPPRAALPGQRFELTVEDETGAVVARFTHGPRSGNRWPLDRRLALALSLPPQGGFVRVRLAASGRGPAGRWEGLAVVAPKPSRPEPPPALAVQPAPHGHRPRLVLVYVMDALRSDLVGHLGGPAGVSPTYDRLAREGVSFARHKSVAPNTVPSTKALFTGRAFVSRGDLPLGRSEGATLAELFRGGGYRTGLFSGNPYVSSAFGTDRGFEHAEEGVILDPAQAPGDTNDNARRVHEAALAWLGSLPAGSSAFLYLHTIHPHNPYAPPEPFRAAYTKGIPSAIDGATETLLAVRQKELEPTPADQRRLRGLYTGSFAYNDAELADFLSRLAAWAPAGETLVVLTSDHGEELFDHGGVLHGYTLYDEQVDIPLVLWAPGRLAPGRVAVPTDTLDLHATLLDLCALPRPRGAEGRSLLGPVDPERYVHLAAASSVVGGIYSARWDRWKLVWAPRHEIFWGMGDGRGRTRDPEYLFDLENDPEERLNRAGDGGLPAAWLRSRLLAWIERNRALGPKPERRPLDAETERRLRALGYANVATAATAANTAGGGGG